MTDQKDTPKQWETPAQQPILPVTRDIAGAPDWLLRLAGFVSRGHQMGNEIDLFHFDGDRLNFESCGQQNGFRYWLASQLMECLGYATMAPILKAVNNAIAGCATLGIPITDNFQEIERLPTTK